MVIREKVAVIGLGYVGLPLLLNIQKKYSVVGFDISDIRISELRKGFDRNQEYTAADFADINTYFTSSISDIADCNIYIVTVPTPVDVNNLPNLTSLRKTCEMLSEILCSGDLVIFESTVYPGATEEICIPLLEQTSDLSVNKDFGVGYSPERVNPGDELYTLEKISKLVSGSDENTLKRVSKFYQTFIKANVYECESIKVAEAAKVMENTQRDVNIALMNEFYSVLSSLDIDTHEVINAASTKWNFHNYLPGLVGGHCISVDPYYFAYKAGMVGVQTNILLASRATNEKLSSVIADKVIKEVMNEKKLLEKPILIVGASFKENCSDFRNTKTVDVYNKLRSYGLSVDMFDPTIDHKKFKDTYEIDLLSSIETEYNLALFLVPHKIFDYSFWNTLIELNNLKTVFDLKNKLSDLGEKLKILR